MAVDDGQISGLLDISKNYIWTSLDVDLFNVGTELEFQLCLSFSLSAVSNLDFLAKKKNNKMIKCKTFLITSNFLYSFSVIISGH